MTPTPSSRSANCSSGSNRREVNPAACRSRQKSFRGLAKCARAAAETRPGLMPTKTTRSPGASTSGTSLGVESPQACPATAKRFPPWGARGSLLERYATNPYGDVPTSCRIDGVDRRSVQSTRDPRVLRGFDLGFVARARVDPLLEGPAQVLAGDGRREARPPRLEPHDLDGRIPRAVATGVALGFGQRSEPTHASQGMDRTGRCPPSATMAPCRSRRRSSATRSGSAPTARSARRAARRSRPARSGRRSTCCSRGSSAARSTASATISAVRAYSSPRRSAARRRS